MSKKISLSLAIILFGAALFAGCVPSDEAIQTELAMARREAYLEWKRSRDSGYTKEAKIDGPISVDDAVRAALQYNKQLQITVQERQVTRGQRIADYSVILPSIKANASAARIENGRGNPDIDSYSMGVTVTQPIFEGEAIPATLRRSRLLTALTDEQVRDAVQNLIANVASEYYDVLLAQHMVEVQREALVSAEAQYRMVSEKKKQETATEYDVLRAQTDVAKYRSQMIMEQNNIDIHRVNMLKYMGVSQDSNVSFSDKLEFLPMRPVLDRAVELASGLRPDLRMAGIDARIADESVRIARSAFWPVISGTFSVGWSDSWKPGSDNFGRQPWSAGIGASYYFGIDVVGNLERFKAQAKQSQIQILDTQENVLQEIRLQMNNLNNSEEQVKALVVNQDAAREALRLVEVGYQAGVKTEVDVTDARKTLTDVMGQYYTALNQHTKARLNLQLAMGVLGPTRISDGAPTPPGVPIANIEEFAATDYVPPAQPPMPASDRPMAPAGNGPRTRAQPGSGQDAGPGAGTGTSTGSRSRPTQNTRQGVSAAPARPQAGATPAPAVASAPVSTPAPRPQHYAAPVPSSIPAPVVAPQPVAAPVATGGMALPPPPTGGPLRASPQAETASAPAPAPTPKAQPMFKVTVREGGSDMPEIARINQ